MFEKTLSRMILAVISVSFVALAACRGQEEDLESGAAPGTGARQDGVPPVSDAANPHDEAAPQDDVSKPGTAAGLQPLQSASGLQPLTSTTGPVGKPSPDFELVLRSGEKITTAQLKGKVVVLNFWATWCPPCIEELPSLERLRRQVKNDPIEVLGVSVDESWAVVDKALAEHPLGYSLALDPGAAVPTQFGTFKFPETFILDREGRVVRQFIGAQIWDRSDIIRYLRNLANPEGEAGKSG